MRKMASAKHLMKLILLMLAAVIVDTKAVHEGDQCILSKAQFIFDSYGFHLSYHQLKRFVNDFVKILPEETLIQVITVSNTEIDKFEFKRINANDTWLENVRYSSSPGIIKYLTINDEIINFFRKTAKPKMLELIYLLVNEKTEIDDVEKVKEAMKYKTIQIVLYRRHSKDDVWTKLSEHIHVLGDDEKEIQPTVQLVMKQSKQSCFEFSSSDINSPTIHNDTSINLQERDDMGTMITWILAIQVVFFVSFLHLAFIKIIHGWRFLKAWLRGNDAKVGTEENKGLLEETKRDDQAQDISIEQLRNDLAKKNEENECLKSEVLSLKTSIDDLKKEINFKDDKIKTMKSERKKTALEIKQAQQKLATKTEQVINLQDNMLKEKIWGSNLELQENIIALFSTIDQSQLRRQPEEQKTKTAEAFELKKKKRWGLNLESHEDMRALTSTIEQSQLRRQPEEQKTKTAEAFEMKKVSVNTRKIRHSY